MILKYRVGNDVGNSSTKPIIRLMDENAQPKAMKQKTLISPNVTIPSVTEDNLETSINNLPNNIIAHINSKAIKRPGTFAIGEKATSVGRVKRNMNITVGDKHKNDIPIVMALGIIATKAVQDYYKLKNELPTDLNVSVEYSTALPAREYDPAVAQIFEKRFLEETHIVDIYVNAKPVTVRITFGKVKVTQEGVPAVYALIEGGHKLLTEYHSEYGKDISNKDFKNRKLLLVDIGDGTTEFIYVVNGKPVNDLCDGKRFGVGHAADVAKKLFDEEVQVDISMTRQQFMQVVFDEEHHFHDKANSVMDDAKIEQGEMILEQVTDMFLNTLAGNVDDIVVFGGGSAAFRESMYQELKDFTDSVNARTLWVPKEMAPSLNAIGLDILNEKVFFKGVVAGNGE
ncbi:hypothetical protein ACOMCU_25455 [Lysinibacillus sp. UGB7]|uniref:hypothetical protein n=1 Tax=Lysinibacillus sp. UGB7 TaxID=3411039 RepID=UPI003B7C782E